ncbi:hypothetical protein [Hydrocoleum sp. CS-953]|uniref:hypothetical protein n=1 Tax=Microcoleaceae TaxID=1892252 RepID=UPI00143D7317|nr:hypothetical protein [Hydrocoleum sp. CS-953]
MLIYLLPTINNSMLLAMTTCFAGQNIASTKVERHTLNIFQVHLLRIEYVEIYLS